MRTNRLSRAHRKIASRAAGIADVGEGASPCTASEIPTATQRLAPRIHAGADTLFVRHRPTIVWVGAALLVLAATPGVAAGDPRFGVMADVGVPDGANASIVYRPVAPLRFSGGIGSNYVSRGVRAGVTLVPFSAAVTPTLAVDYGRYERGDANPLVQAATGDMELHSDVLSEVGYSYANAHVGLELGHRWFTFFIHGGMSRIDSDLRNLNSADSSVTFSQHPHVTMYAVSARLGFVFYFLR